MLGVSDLAPGSYQLSARYAGDDEYRGSDSATVSHTVIEGTAVVETSTVLTSSANPSTYGELITFRAEVSTADDSSPSGTVQFSVDGQDFGGPIAVGPDGVAVARGLVNFDAEELPRLRGRNSHDIEAELGSSYAREVIHRDDMVLL